MAIRQRLDTRQSKGRLFAPEVVTVLGKPGQMVLNHPATGQMHVWEPVGGTLLCCNKAGDEMFILCPLYEDEISEKDVALHIENEEMWERFTHRPFEGWFNGACPSFRKPQYRGQIVIIRYEAQKDLDDESAGETIEWEHCFEAPDYAELWSVGSDQYYIPRGPWRITDRGIQHRDDR
jgi:hypothetical protein